ncbi:TlpA family protein disulfide reductase [Leifsonia sp. 22587]|uniref:TlpA family protein disulfide reductase n=1 Tax=Leifsonia sp. 22587 TaxID=3453946 RepID=UPI003F85B788
MANRNRRTTKLRTALTSVAAAAVLVVTLAGCSNNEALAQQYKDGSGKNYVAGDGTITEIKPQNRAAPVAFAGTLEDGKPITSAMYAGKVLVLNFWYAGCAPCRAEAPALERTYTKFAGHRVEFMGVNVRDQADTARAFARTYKVTYPSVLDASDGAMQLAFSGIVAPNAVPTTLVIDKDGRVAARILGQLPDASVLSALISTVLTEQGP